MGNRPFRSSASATRGRHPAGQPVEARDKPELHRPGGNATGVSFLSAALEAKRLGMLHELLPHATAIAALVDPSFVTSADQLKALQDAAVALGWRVDVLRASTESEIDAGFARLVQQHSDALIVSAVPFFETQRDQIIKL